jgi:hypothetical protein
VCDFLKVHLLCSGCAVTFQKYMKPQDETINIFFVMFTEEPTYSGKKVPKHTNLYETHKIQNANLKDFIMP